METIQEAAELMTETDNIVNEQTAMLYQIKNWLDEKANGFAGAGVEGHAATLHAVAEQVEGVAQVLQGGISSLNDTVALLLSLA
jgi:hypothetical protein